MEKVENLCNLDEKELQDKFNFMKEDVKQKAKSGQISLRDVNELEKFIANNTQLVDIDSINFISFLYCRMNQFAKAKQALVSIPNDDLKSTDEFQKNLIGINGIINRKQKEYEHNNLLEQIAKNRGRTPEDIADTLGISPREVEKLLQELRQKQKGNER